MNKVSLYTMAVYHACRAKAGIWTGKYYTVCAPPPCASYTKNELTYYYRDFIPKTNWLGPVDHDGYPFVQACRAWAILSPDAISSKSSGALECLE